MRAGISNVDPRLAIADLRSLEDIVGDALREQRVTAVLVAGFAMAALLLAAMGLFGVVAGAVLRRRRELAVRSRARCRARSVLRLVLSEGARLIVIGV